MTALLLTALLLAPTAASASDGAPNRYATAIRLIDHLYLEPDRVEAPSLLAAAARSVSDRVPWLFVEVDPDHQIRLVHGDGRPLGALQPSTLDALPAQLKALEGLVTRAPAPLPEGVDVPLAILDGLTDALDHYSRVLSGDGLARFDTRLKGTLVGIGASFAWQAEALVVTRVDRTGPAEAAGLRVGDRVKRIDGRSTVNMPLNEVTSRVQGEEGAPVTLTVSRLEHGDLGDGNRVRTLPLTIRRARVLVPNVTHEALDDGVGYVRIDHVSQTTVQNLRQSLEALEEAGSLDVGLVLDLRGNTGGSMKEAARTADVFLTSGLLLRTAGHDGGRVQNLEAEMNAVDSDDELDLPVVLLVDRRTASGSEIIAGALLEHQRTALIGTHTYGKGTVQKIYNLDEDTRLKLTVARYLLANDRRILPAGIAPDVRIGRIHLDAHQMELEQVSTDPTSGLVVVDEGEGWRGQPRSDDAVRELGRRAVLRAQGSTTRQALLDALAVETQAARVHEDQRLADAMEARGLDWTAASEEGSFPEATVHAKLRPTSPTNAELQLSVTHQGESPLHQAFLALDSRHGFWDDRAIPLGRIAPGETVEARLPVSFPPGGETRVDPVTFVLHADQRPPSQLQTLPLRIEERPEPQPRLDARLVPHAPGGTPALGPHGHPVYRAELTIGHDGPGAITGAEVYFRTPADERIELLDRGARHPRIGPGEGERFDLTLEMAPGVEVAALELRVDVETFDHWLSWDIDLPLDGERVHYQAPTIDFPGRPTTVESGPLPFTLRIDDDGKLGDTTLWVNGTKTHWFPPNGSRTQATATLSLRSGANRITAITRDQQGLQARRTVYIQAVEADRPTDAEAAP